MSDKVVAFPPTEVGPDERARRLRNEVERLACQSTTEWLFWLEDSAKQHGIEPAKLKQMVEAQVRANDKTKRQAEAENRRREKRAEKEQADARRAEERKRRKQEREQERAEKEKEREKRKVFAALIRLPKAEHEKWLVEVAKCLDVELELLKDEFTDFATSSHFSS
jgi:hypothetical protein